MRKLQVLIVCTLCIIATGCATKSIHFQRKLNDDLRAQISKKNYDKALELISSKKYYPEERSKLVRLLNQASVLYYSEKYLEAIDKLNEARDLSEQLYTVSISKKAKTLVTSDNLDNYYGEIYERSLIRYYTALVNFKLYHIEKDSKKARAYLFNARAAILDWDTYLDTKSQELAGRPTYKKDMAAKILGALIHQEIGSSSEKQIARQLYIDAQKVLKQNYGAYPTFNQASGKYVKDYSDLPKKSTKELKQYIVPTNNAATLTQFIESSAKKMQKRKSDNTVVLVNYGLIAPKVPKIYEYPLRFGTVIPASGKALSIGSFAASLLSVPGAGIPKIKFERPNIDLSKQLPANIEIEIKKKGISIAKGPAAILNPVSEVAQLEVENNKIQSLSKAGARIATKHIATITGLYFTYSQAFKKGGIAQALALPAAIASYRLTASQLNKSELADLREWTLLPQDQAIATFNLPPGEYEIFINGKMLKKATITKGNRSNFIDIFAP